MAFVGLGVCVPTQGWKEGAETMPMAQHSLPGQVAGSGLLGLHRRESLADSRCHIQRYFQAAQCVAWQIWLLLNKKGLCVLHSFSELKC